MKTFVEPCDDRQLQWLLKGDEDSAEFKSAASHVETCERCQARLSDLAASADEWAETRELLEDDESDALAAECRESAWSVASQNPSVTCSAETTHWTEAVVKQYLAAPSHPEMLGRLGRYEIERLIGAGGMGVVFKGFDTELNRPVALKMLAPHLAGHGAARQRFAREARAAAAVVHEHVVAIHNVESEGTAPFLVMKFVAGESLQGRIDRQGPLELCEILRIGHQTAAGLAAAHAQGLVHRDVKPSNIMLEQGVDRALLTDFGLARASDDASLTHTGYMPGTPHYMSPEQSRGESVDVRSDLFSLGSVLYTMCTGRPPFRAETHFGVLRRITDNDPRSIREVNPAIPEWLEAIIAKLHAKAPTARFASASQVASLLESCLAHVQQPTMVPLPDECRVKHTKRFASKFDTYTWNPTAARMYRLALRCLGIAAIMGLGAFLAVKSGLMAPAVPETGTSSKQHQQQAASTESNSTQRDAASDWDDIDRQTRRLLEDSEELQARANRIWDFEPQATATPRDVNSPNTNQPETQEIQK